MSEVSNASKDTLGYLGPSYQLKVLWQILTDVEFGNEIVPNLHSAYIDVPVQKRLLSLIKKYLDQNGKVPQIGNKSIVEHINASNYSDVEKEELHGTVKRIISWHKSTEVGSQDDDGKAVQDYVWLFVKQQEYKKLADKIYEKIKKGTIQTNVFEFEEDIKKISLLGLKDDFGKDVFDDIKSALEKNFRHPIPTGIAVIDQAMGGGLGKEEIGIILAPFGIGKTTILTKIANNAYECEKNVLQLVFEDKVDEIRRKHFAIWSKIPLSQIDERSEEVYEKVSTYQANHDAKNYGGRLIVKKLPQEDVTIPFIKNWILNYQKNFNIKFDMVVLDYIDCVESHKPTNGDDLKAELVVIKAFESMAAELKIPCWTAVQGNRQSVSAEFVRADQMGGSIKRAQKTHFLMSIARSPDQKQDNTANIQILKARFAKDGFTFENAIFNNDTLEIRCFENTKHKPKPKRNPTDPTMDSELETQMETMKSEYMTKALDTMSTGYLVNEQIVKNKENEIAEQKSSEKSGSEPLRDDEEGPVK
jgi:DnaB-like helicase C terminal domain